MHLESWEHPSSESFIAFFVLGMYFFGQLQKDASNLQSCGAIFVS